MPKILGIILLCASLIGHAQTLTTELSNGVIVRLGTEACTDNSILAKLKPEYHNQFFTGNSDIPGNKGLSLCWAVNPKTNNIYVIDTLGNVGEIEPSEFK